MSKSLTFWQVDAFTQQPFKGNPAAVFILEHPISDELMQNIAIEMNLSETAYILLRDNHLPLLRWFTPTFEIDLCGHATLASAHIFLTEYAPQCHDITFDTNTAGPLRVTQQADYYTMDFPSRPGKPVKLANIPPPALDALTTVRPVAAYKARDLMLVYDDATTVRNMTPDFTALKNYDDFIIATARLMVTTASDDSRYDFISRFFCAGDGMNEDPVTGSAHCTLAPYWAKTLGKNRLHAYQASQRGGELLLDVKEERIHISGHALTVIKGTLQPLPNQTI